MSDRIPELYRDVITLIAGHVDAPDLGRMARVNRQWRDGVSNVYPARLAREAPQLAQWRDRLFADATDRELYIQAYQSGMLTTEYGVDVEAREAALEKIETLRFAPIVLAGIGGGLLGVLFFPIFLPIGIIVLCEHGQRAKRIFKAVVATTLALSAGCFMAGGACAWKAHKLRKFTSEGIPEPDILDLSLAQLREFDLEKLSRQAIFPTRAMAAEVLRIDVLLERVNELEDEELDGALSALYQDNDRDAYNTTIREVRGRLGGYRTAISHDYDEMCFEQRCARWMRQHPGRALPDLEQFRGRQHV